MNCERVQNGLLLTLDGELPPQESKAIDKHLAQCTACREMAEELLRIHNLVDQALHTEVSAPESLSFRVMHVLGKRPHPRFPWMRLLPKLNIRSRLVPTLLALCLLFSGYSLGYWQAHRQLTLPLSDLRLSPTRLPDTDLIVRIKRPKIPSIHRVPFWTQRPKKA